MIDPAIKKIRDEFIRGLGAEMRAQGFDEKHIAWLLGPEAVAANDERPTRNGRRMTGKGPTQTPLIEAVRLGPLFPMEIAKVVGKPYSTVTTTLYGLVNSGLIVRRGDGRYEAA